MAGAVLVGTTVPEVVVGAPLAVGTIVPGFGATCGAEATCVEVAGAAVDAVPRPRMKSQPPATAMSSTAAMAIGITGDFFFGPASSYPNDGVDEAWAGAAGAGAGTATAAAAAGFGAAAGVRGFSSPRPWCIGSGSGS